MHRCRLPMVVLLVAALLYSCGATSAKPEAEALTQKYFTAMKEGKVGEAIPLYSKEFFKETSKDKWQIMLAKINNKLGNVKSYELATWRVNTYAGTGESGTYVSLIYNVQYEKYKGTESFNIFKPASGGAVKLLGHNFNSEGLILEGNENINEDRKPVGVKKDKGINI